MRVELSRTFHLESARRLPRLPATHPCARVHGHSFALDLVVRGEVDPEVGWLIDYNDIDRAFAPLRAALDHAYLNDVPGLDNPTSEHLARWVFERLVPTLPGLAFVSVRETADTRATYPGPDGAPLT